ncbi:MAG: hypothetical protein ACJAVV_003212 [Alphaproteobacteria bacterium]
MIVNIGESEDDKRILFKHELVKRALEITKEEYGELGQYKPLGKELAVMPKLVLCIHLASYMFVSPKQPRIYQRLNSGLHALNINGKLSDTADKRYKEFIELAKI